MINFGILKLEVSNEKARNHYIENSGKQLYVGSYRLSIYGTGKNELTFVISNDMGLNSLTAGLLPNINSGAMSTIETWFWWKEPIR